MPPKQRGSPLLQQRDSAAARTASDYSTAGQALVSAVNDPRSQKTGSGWFGIKAVDNSWRDPPPPVDAWKYPDITKQDFERYLQIVGKGRVEQFQQDRASLAEGLSQQLLLEGKGEGHACCPSEQNLGSTRGALATVGR